MSGYDLKRPCPKCPFRSDVKPYITAERAWEIVDSLRMGAEFYCHQTTDDDRLDDFSESGFYNPNGNEQFCAGALISMEHDEEPNQMMRIAERLGLYDPEGLDMDALVRGGLDEFGDAHERAEAKR